MTIKRNTAYRRRLALAIDTARAWIAAGKSVSRKGTVVPIATKRSKTCK